MAESITVNPSGYSNYSGSTSSSYPISNAYTAGSSTSYARITCTTGSNASSYLELTFDLSDIPNNATIDSVSCSAKARISSTSYISTAYIQLYNSTTAMGSSTSYRSTSTSTTYNLTCGTWTRSALEDCRIRFNATRGTSNTTRAAYIYVYGADLTVTYTYNAVKYTVTTSATNGTITPSGAIEVIEGDSLTLSLKANDGYTLDSLKVDGVSVTPVETTISGLDGGVCLVQNSITDLLGLSSVSVSGVTTSTTQSKFGGTSFYFSGSGYMTLSLPSDQKPCTLEFWVYPTVDNASGSYPTLFSSAAYGSAGGTYMHLDDGSYSTYPVCRANSSSSTSNNGGYGSTVITRNAWHHIAMCYNGNGSHYYFVDGVLQYTVSQSSPNSYQTWYLGCLYGSSSPVSDCYFTGYMDEILVSDSCKWTANFSIPTSAYSIESETLLTYTLSNVTSDKTVIAVFSDGGAKAYIKVNGSWVAASAVYIKSNGSWTQISDLTTIDTTKNYVIS